MTKTGTDTILLISTHTLTWSVTLTEYRVQQLEKHFNSHAHVERDNVVNLLTMYNTISTHTLTWSVTAEVWENTYIHMISTHTLTWSVT